MGAEAYSRKILRTDSRKAFNRPHPLGLGAKSRGPLSGLPRASVPKDCAARHQQHQIEPATSQAQELQASCRNLHASTAVPALSSFLHGHLSVVHAVITVYPWPFYFLMAFAPRADLTKRLLTGAKCLVPLALLYGVLLCASWTPDTLSTLLPGDFAEGMKSALEGKPKIHFIPEIQAVGKLLSAPIASVSAWAHLQFIAFFCARWIWMDGLMRGVNTVHSVLLCAVLPPLGFLAHIITTFLKRQFSSADGSATNSTNGSAPAKVQAPAAPAAVSAPTPPSAPPSAPPSTPAQPSGNDAGWETAAAGVGIAGSHPRTADGNGAAADVVEDGNSAAATGKAAAAATAEDPASMSRPGGRGRDAEGDALTDSSSGSGTASSEYDDRSWLTVLEPVFIQRH